MNAMSLTNHLLRWTLGTLTLVWVSFIVVAYLTGVHESEELTDGHLASVVALLASQRGAQTATWTESTRLPTRPDLRSHDYQQSLSVFVWDAAGQLLTRTGDAPVPAFDPEEGFATLELGQPVVAWRSFSRWDSPAGSERRKVMALLSLEERHELAQDISEEIVVPGFFLLPVVALVLGLAVRKGLRPLYDLSRDVDALDPRHAMPLRDLHPHEEFRAVVRSINTLVERQHSTLERERQLASELAHELRTPLASLALQARSLRTAGVDPEGQAIALAQLEQDALRAGEVLSHLLVLARASRTEMAETVQAVDLDALAREVVASYAQAAVDTGHELALVSPGPFTLRGHPVLLGLALRNLVENALRHTPAGSTVEVQLDPVAGWCQVVDNGQRTTEARGGAAPATAEWGLGLGLGHRVVAKIAAIHNARFSHEVLAAPQSGWAAYRLAFEVDAAPAAT